MKVLIIIANTVDKNPHEVCQLLDNALGRDDPTHDGKPWSSMSNEECWTTILLSKLLSLWIKAISNFGLTDDVDFTSACLYTCRNVNDA